MTDTTNMQTPFFLGFRPQGRYGRLNYANAFCLILLINVIATQLLRHTISDIDQYLLSYTLVNAVLMLFLARCIALRLHDIGFKAWAAYIWLLIGLSNNFDALINTTPAAPTASVHYLLLTLAMLAFNVFLLSKKGNPQPNLYGQVPKKGAIWGLLCCSVIFIVGIIAAFAIPMLASPVSRIA